MPGESILLIEDSPAERDIARTILSDAGYEVIVAANAAAAMTCPQLEDIDMVVMDATLDGVTGYDTTRMLRQKAETHPIPILLLIAEDTISEREDLSTRGANGFLLKPYGSKSLVRKVGNLFEEMHLEDIAKQYLADQADIFMNGLAEKHIKEAVERKTRIIVERSIQNVATAVDQQAREEVESKVTALTAEKEQELVKLTVREVAQSMVEKLAERKVSEAMEAVLTQETERAVRRAADQALPNMIRDRTKDILANMLPREVQIRLQKAAEKMVPEISEQLVGTVEAVAGKAIPRVARDVLPELAEKQFRIAANDQIPRIVQEVVGRELETQMHRRIEPAIRDAARALRKTVLIWASITGGMVAVGLGLLLYLIFFAG